MKNKLDKLQYQIMNRIQNMNPTLTEPQLKMLEKNHPEKAQEIRIKQMEQEIQTQRQRLERLKMITLLKK